jgi:hypothetical protein
MRAQRAQTKKAAFLEAYARIGTIVHAAQHVGLPRRTHYKWLKKDPTYAQQMSEAEEEAIQHLEREARRRAMVGVEEPVYYKGQVCGAVRKYSDTLLIFLLKSKRPAVYRDYHSVDVAVTVNQEINTLIEEGRCRAYERNRRLALPSVTPSSDVGRG